MADLKERVEALEYDFQVIGHKLDDLKGQVEALPREILSEVRTIVLASEQRLGKALRMEMAESTQDILAAIKDLKRT